MSRYQIALDLLYTACIQKDDLLLNNDFIKETIEEAREVLQELINEVEKCQDVESQ